jgi:chorismate mutase
VLLLYQHILNAERNKKMIESLVAKAVQEGDDFAESLAIFKRLLMEAGLEYTRGYAGLVYKARK